MDGSGKTGVQAPDPGGAPRRTEGRPIHQSYVRTTISCKLHAIDVSDVARRELAQLCQTPALRSAFGGIWDIAYSAIAVIVRLGFTPRFAGMIDPSTT